MESSKVKSPIINLGYTDNLGNRYDNIREIAHTNESLCSNLGKYITESNMQSMNGLDMDDSQTGVYIYQDRTNENIGYRIYKDKNAPSDDHIMVSKLVSRQPHIHYSTFPTGVVTLNGKLIGEEIPFFKDSTTIYQFILDTVRDGKTNILPTKIYLLMLKVIRELYDNGIFFLDGHCKNFMITKDGIDKITNNQILKSDDIKTIDFESRWIVFDDLNDRITKYIIDTLVYYNFAKINSLLGIKEIVGQFPNCNSLSELEEAVLEQEHKLIKFGYPKR